MPKIQIANVGLGNPNSIKNILLKLGYISEFIKDGSELNTKLLFIPGVGNFDYASKIFKSNDWYGPIRRHLDEGNWLIGICLGMQILCERSDEGLSNGLNIIPGTFSKFKANKIRKVPNMGWRDLHFVENKNSLLDFTSLNNLKMKFYFVHSYFYSISDLSYASGLSEYGIKFPAIISKDKCIGFQFHPEKSHVYGMKLLQYTLSQIFKNE